VRAGARHTNIEYQSALSSTHFGLCHCGASQKKDEACVCGLPKSNKRGRSIRSIIEADAQIAGHEELRDYLRKHFADAFVTKDRKAREAVFKDSLARRGPDGVVKLELLEDAKPQMLNPIRATGLRAVALDALISGFLTRGLAEPVGRGCEWASRAFLVPKPNGKWRLVVDYRYLNTVIKGCPYPLPVIEDQLLKQSGNVLWSLIDLEDTIRWNFILIAGI
jgi:hypothetical protein